MEICFHFNILAQFYFCTFSCLKVMFLTLKSQKVIFSNVYYIKYCSFHLMSCCGDAQFAQSFGWMGTWWLKMYGWKCASKKMNWFFFNLHSIIFFRNYKPINSWSKSFTVSMREHGMARLIQSKKCWKIECR